MNNGLSPFTEQSEKKSPSGTMWNAITAVLSILVVAISTKVPSAPWLPYVCGLSALIVAILAFYDSSVREKLKNLNRKPKDKKTLSNASNSMIDYLEEATVTHSFCHEMTRLEWNTHHYQEGYHFENKHTRMKRFFEESDLPLDKKTLTINFMLDAYLDDVNDHLHKCDNDLRGGIANYKSEHQAKEFKKRLDKYEDFIKGYTAFCKNLNKQLKTTLLTIPYGRDLHFDWKDALDRTGQEQPTNG